MIHVNDPEFDAQRFREHFNMHASTSPQYAIIASLDVGPKTDEHGGLRTAGRYVRPG